MSSSKRIHLNTDDGIKSKGNHAHTTFDLSTANLSCESNQRLSISLIKAVIPVDLDAIGYNNDDITTFTLQVKDPTMAGNSGAILNIHITRSLYQIAPYNATTPVRDYYFPLSYLDNPMSIIEVLNEIIAKQYPPSVDPLVFFSINATSLSVEVLMGTGVVSVTLDNAYVTKGNAKYNDTARLLWTALGIATEVPTRAVHTPFPTITQWTPIGNTNLSLPYQVSYTHPPINLISDLSLDSVSSNLNGAKNNILSGIQINIADQSRSIAPLLTGSADPIPTPPTPLPDIELTYLAPSQFNLFASDVSYVTQTEYGWNFTKNDATANKCELYLYHSSAPGAIAFNYDQLRNLKITMKNNLVLSAGEIFMNVYTGPPTAPNWYKTKDTYDMTPALGTTLDTALVDHVLNLSDVRTDPILAIAFHSNSGNQNKDFDVSKASFEIIDPTANTTQQVVVNLTPLPPGGYIGMNFNLDCVCYDAWDEQTIMAFKDDVVQFFKDERLTSTASRIAMFPEIATSTVSSVYRSSQAGSNPNTFWQLYFYNNAGDYWRYEVNGFNPTTYTFLATGSHPWMSGVGPRGEGWNLWFRNVNGVAQVDLNGNTGQYVPYGPNTSYYPTLPNTQVPDACWHNTTTGVVYVSIVDTIYELDTATTTVTSFAKYNQPVVAPLAVGDVITPAIHSLTVASHPYTPALNGDYVSVGSYYRDPSPPRYFKESVDHHLFRRDTSTNTYLLFSYGIHETATWYIGIYPVLSNTVDYLSHNHTSLGQISQHSIGTGWNDYTGGGTGHYPTEAYTPSHSLTASFTPEVVVEEPEPEPETETAVVATNSGVYVSQSSSFINHQNFSVRDSHKVVTTQHINSLTLMLESNEGNEKYTGSNIYYELEIKTHDTNSNNLTID